MTAIAGPAFLSLQGSNAGGLSGRFSAASWDVAIPMEAPSLARHMKLGAGAAAACLSGAAALLRRRRPIRNGAVVSCAAAKTKQAAPKSSRSVAKETLARLRARVPRKKGQEAKKMPPEPDPWMIDEEGRKIFPWPKSFAEIVQTAHFATMNLIMAGEVRIEVDFPPLPLADLDWNVCDVAETRIVDSNIQHAIAFGKLLVKDKRVFPKLDPETAVKEAAAGAPMQQPEMITKMLERRFKKKPEGDLGRTVRIIFPNKTDMLRARDIHYEKWKKMERPELLRRGWIDEVNEEQWPGPFEDVFVYICCQDSSDLPKFRTYVEKADAVASRQGRVLRHILFNCNLNKLKADIAFYKTVIPFQPGLATPRVHYDFLSTFRNAYLIRFGKYNMTVFRDPYNIAYIGAMYHAHPGPWQIFSQDDEDGAYVVIDVSDKRQAIKCFQRKLMRAKGLAREGGLPEETTMDDVYRPANAKAGTINKPAEQVLREGFGDWLWFEECLEEEISDKWRLA